MSGRAAREQGEKGVTRHTPPPRHTEYSIQEKGNGGRGIRYPSFDLPFCMLSSVFCIPVLGGVGTYPSTIRIPPSAIEKASRVQAPAVIGGHLGFHSGQIVRIFETTEAKLLMASR